LKDIAPNEAQFRSQWNIDCKQTAKKRRLATMLASDTVISTSVYVLSIAFAISSTARCRKITESGDSIF
jgi:hypothetical protein